MSRRHKKHPQFEIDYEFYHRVRDQFNFCGSDMKSTYDIQFSGESDHSDIDSNGNSITIPWGIPYSEDGKTAKECFYKLDSEGKKLPCSEPQLLVELLTCKGGVNLQIKTWAQGRAEFTLCLKEIVEYTQHYQCPDWVLKAVENQKVKILKEWVSEKKWKQHGIYGDTFYLHLGEALQDMAPNPIKLDLVPVPDHLAFVLATIIENSTTPIPEVILGEETSTKDNE